jgi:acyl-coenzyme A synthetase/AMP-(fatty) acid ligase
MNGPEDPERVFLLPDVTYRQVAAMAAALRPALAEARKAVCLLSENRAVSAAAMIAALHTGRPLVLPHEASAAAVAQMRRRIDFSSAVVDGNRPLPAGVEPVFVDPSAAVGLSADPPTALPAPDTEWVRLFTGGSTGRPQIWSKTVANLLGEAAYQAENFRYSEKDRIVATVPVYHIYGILYSLLAPLIATAAVSAETPSYPAEIATACQTCRATVLVSVPVHYRALRETGTICPALRLALSSAGPLEAADADAFLEQSGTGVKEIYGSTETGGIASRCRAEGQRGLHPFSVVDWKITNERLFVRSEFLSPELALDASGFFRTGDRAVETSEGGIALLGREDGLVKVGGKRVDTEEIREQLRSFPGVREAWVAGLPSKTGRQTAIGALVEGEVEPAQVRRHLAGRLAAHAVPKRLRVVDKIPMTAAGKIDRERALARLMG